MRVKNIIFMIVVLSLSNVAFPQSGDQLKGTKEGISYTYAIPPEACPDEGHEKLINGIFSFAAVDTAIWTKGSADIYFDLKRMRDISKVVVKSFKHSPHYALETIELYVENNGEYKLVEAVPGYEHNDTKTYQTFEIPLDIRCSRLRLRIYNVTGKYISLSEVEFYDKTSNKIAIQ